MQAMVAALLALPAAERPVVDATSQTDCALSCCVHTQSCTSFILTQRIANKLTIRRTRARSSSRPSVAAGS